MMQQYLALKAEAPQALLLFRMGDFYELFLDDAKVAAAALDIALTSRGTHLGAPLPMCGVPVQSHESYVARLVKAGHAVAIAEQVEDPALARRRGAKAVVRRDIVRVLTPGTLTEERLLEGRRSNWLLALAPAGDRAGLAWVDVSTGELWLGEVAARMADDEIARIAPAEILRPEGATDRRFDSALARSRLAALLEVETLDGFGEFPGAALAAAGAILAHLDSTARGQPLLLQPPRLAAIDGIMAIDRATRRSLELVEGEAPLLGAIDLTVTAAGGRLLAAELAAPLRDLAAIAARLDLVQWFVGDDGLRGEVRRLLRGTPDLGRALGRLVAGRGTPRDLGNLRDGLQAAGELAATLDWAAAAGAPAALAPLQQQLQPPAPLLGQLQAALVASPPLAAAEGGVIAAGHDAALDAARQLAQDGRAALAALEAELRLESGVASLKVRHNNAIGYHIEVGRKAGEALLGHDQFQHRQTLGTSMRFRTAALDRLAADIGSAEGNARLLEAEWIARLTAAATAARTDIAAVAAALAAIDRSAALAELAARGGWTRPQLTSGRDFHITAGRHPVVEAALRQSGRAFVPNDCVLEDDARIWLVTGPNMGGKSTFLRQNALIAILAQAGGFVPAAAATIGIVDRLYSRVGASDSLADGRSTFMVEMVETAAILNGASGNSLLLLDEVGRGTATWDGLALAWAILERIHDVVGARCLFASHYHELAALAERLPALALRHLSARQWQGELVFLHEVAPGSAPGSFGIDVARLAGVPAEVLQRAGEILARLEHGALGAQARAALADLPLFAAAQPPPAARTDALRARLEAVQPDQLTPRAALDLVYELKQLLAEGGPGA